MFDQRFVVQYLQCQIQLKCFFALWIRDELDLKHELIAVSRLRFDQLARAHNASVRLCAN